MANIKDISKASDKWVRRASVAQPDYVDGVKNPRTSWSESAIAAHDSYKAGVQAAINKGSYVAGIKSAGDEAWAAGAEKKGADRYAQGVALAKDNWQVGYEPYAKVIADVKLPPRGPKGSPQNYQRVQAVGQALRAHKEKMKGK